MALTGKLTGHIEPNSGWDVLHDLIVHKPNNISSICPDSFHGCDLVSGQRGVGSTICWNYTHDGKKKSSKQIIEAVDEINHKIVFKVIEGDLVGIYNNFTITFHVEPKDVVQQLATWTFEFEKPNASVPDPVSLMDLMCGIIKDMDVHVISSKLI
ncbi:MLP-like protein 43 [Bidens hawaiensis]|uniref:MLP-like protein 43 n=1 Tax=Bidens hawaiensis TaxID=980011 RepID=UPI004049AABE